MKFQGGCPGFSLTMPIPLPVQFIIQVGFSFCTLVLGGAARALDLWRAAEDSTDPFSLSTSSVLLLKDRDCLPCPQKTNTGSYLVSTGTQGALWNWI